MADSGAFQQMFAQHRNAIANVHLQRLLVRRRKRDVIAPGHHEHRECAPGQSGNHPFRRHVSVLLEQSIRESPTAAPSARKVGTLAAQRQGTRPRAVSTQSRNVRGASKVEMSAWGPVSGLGVAGCDSVPRLLGCAGPGASRRERSDRSEAPGPGSGRSTAPSPCPGRRGTRCRAWSGERKPWPVHVRRTCESCACAALCAQELGRGRLCNHMQGHTQRPEIRRAAADDALRISVGKGSPRRGWRAGEESGATERWPDVPTR